MAFIYDYTKIHGVPPAEADFQRYFKTSPPAIHPMIVILDKRGIIERRRAFRSSDLPKAPHFQGKSGIGLHFEV